MIKLLKDILSNNTSEEDKKDTDNLELLSGLMIEAAYTDGRIDEIEKNRIKLSLINVFEEDPKEVDSILQDALKNKNNSKSLHHYTSLINKNFSNDKKLL